jgi:hypothetical protein
MRRSILVMSGGRIVAEFNGKVTRRKAHAVLRDGASCVTVGHGNSIVRGSWITSIGSMASSGEVTRCREMFATEDGATLTFQMRSDAAGTTITMEAKR